MQLKNAQYFSSLAQAISTFGINYVRLGIVARALGPSTYGVFGLLQSSYDSIIDFLQLNTSGGLFNYVARHKDIFNLLKWYAKFSAFLFLILIIGTKIVTATGSLNTDISPKYFYFAMLFSFLLWTSKIFSGIGDAKSLTVMVQKRIIIFNFLNLVLFVILSYYNLVNLTTLFLVQIFISSLLIISLSFLYKKMKIVNEPPISKNSKNLIKSYFIKYSSPLVILSVVNFLYTIFDRWFLQFIGGSMEQGLFTFSLKISAICMIFSGAMVAIWSREISKMHEEMNLEQMATFYSKYIIIFFSITSIVSIFIFFNCDIIIELLGGKRFENALNTVMIMSLYPIHQTLGQLNNSFCLATERTKIFSVIMAIVPLLGIPLTYYLIAPDSYYFSGLNMNSDGLALKFLIVQLFTSNIVMYFNTKYLNLSFFKKLYVQFVIPIMLFLIYFFMRSIIYSFWEIESLFDKIILSGLTGIFYFVTFTFIVYQFPFIIGLKRYEIKNYFKL